MEDILHHRVTLPILVVVSALAATGSAFPQAGADYPARTVTIVVPFTPAGTTDILGRFAAQALEQRLGKPFVVENRPGAGQQIGVGAVAKSAPDGHTLLVAASSALAINPTLYKRLSYDPVKDFTPIAMLAHLPFVLVVDPSLPVRTVTELVAYAKARPGGLSYGSGGVGASHHLYGELFKSLTGVEMTHVPYKGTVPALNDVIAGHIQVLFSDAPPVLPQIRAGKVRALGVTTAARMPIAPDIAPLGDSIPGFNSAPWQMLVTRAGTPRAIVDRLHDEISRHVASRAGTKQLTEMGLIPGEATSPDELARFVTSEIETWGRIVRQAGAAGTQ
jgi:tripartite-type tricarboxylate transporter receptor subunit TctC